MTIKEIQELFYYIENKYNVDDWTIDGVEIWPLIRLENYYLLSIESLSAKKIDSTKSAKYLFKVFKANINVLIAKVKDYKKNIVIKKTDVVFLSDGVSFAKLNDKWFEKFSDPLIDRLSKSGVKSIRLDLSHEFLHPRANPSKFIQTEIDFTILKSIFKSKISAPIFSKENWADFDEFLTDSVVLNGLISIPNRLRMRNRMAKIFSLSKYYEKILVKARPKTAFVVSYYGDQQLAFLLACKRLSIYSVDIQHGVQGEFHLAYGSWFKVPSNGYKLLPNDFFVWSEAEKSEITKWMHTKDNNKVVVSGNMFANMWLDKNNEVVSKYDELVNNLKNNINDKTILLTLSPYTDKYMDIIWDVVYKTQRNYNWFIRLHPAMINDKRVIVEDLKNRKIKNYILEEATDLPLYAILRNIDVHITVQSSCVIEASIFGVFNIITSEYGRNLYPVEINAGKAQYCETQSEIINAIEQSNGNKEFEVLNFYPMIDNFFNKIINSK